jgi:hypothetical protein
LGRVEPGLEAREVGGGGVALGLEIGEVVLDLGGGRGGVVDVGRVGVRAGECGHEPDGGKGDPRVSGDAAKDGAGS